MSQENLSSGFPTRWDSNWIAQLRNLAEIFNFFIFDIASTDIIQSNLFKWSSLLNTNLP